MDDNVKIGYILDRQEPGFARELYLYGLTKTGSNKYRYISKDHVYDSKAALLKDYINEVKEAIKHSQESIPRNQKLLQQLEELYANAQTQDCPTILCGTSDISAEVNATSEKEQNGVERTGQTVNNTGQLEKVI